MSQAYMSQDKIQEQSRCHVACSLQARQCLVASNGLSLVKATLPRLTRRFHNQSTATPNLDRGQWPGARRSICQSEKHPNGR